MVAAWFGHLEALHKKRQKEMKGKLNIQFRRVRMQSKMKGKIKEEKKSKRGESRTQQKMKVRQSKVETNNN